MPLINKLDNIITKGKIRAEKKITKNRYTHPWSPSLAVAILTLSLWKAKISALRNSRDKQHVVNKLLKKIKSFPGRSIAIQIYSHESKKYTPNLKLSRNT